MSSYYNRIEGSLKPGQTALSADIHLIQSEIQDAIQRALIDIHGAGVVLGEEENALKLEPTTQHIDQSNTNFDEDDPGLNCYEFYFRQPIDIEKSSIETIRLEMLNNSNIDVTVYAEIQDEDFTPIGETSTVLKVTEPNVYEPIDFVFTLNHLPLGRYYFILRPIDVSAVDLAKNGDETVYDVITESMFKVKYDNEGLYDGASLEDTFFNEEDIIADDISSIDDGAGLYISQDGNQYIRASVLKRFATDSDTSDTSTANFDLFFEHIFSSGNTYLINNGAAIVLGEKVYPLDTHVTIDGPSTQGDRTDLVVLTPDGHLNVIKGSIYNGEKIYPTDNSGLNIAYITSYRYGLTEDEQEDILNGKSTLLDVQSGTYNRRVPSIEQDDENNMTRHRDILERLRRLEKKVQYQQTNNSPTRIKYNCVVDPVLANNGANEDILGEGSYGLSEGVASDGSAALTPGRSKEYKWSIISNSYNYNTTKTSKVTGELVITDVDMPLSKPKKSTDIKSYMQLEIELLAPGYGTGKEDNPLLTAAMKKKKWGGVPYAKLAITVKKSGKVVATYNVKTNKYGYYKLSLWNIKKLKKGTYQISVKYDGKTVGSTMKVYADNHNFKDVKHKTHSKSVEVATTVAAESSATIASDVFAGDDAFEKDKIDFDTDNGTVTIQHAGNTGEYEKNKLLKDMKVFSSSEKIYKLRNDKNTMTSEYPALNFTLKSDTYIKTITPYIVGFKNIDKFGILIFKNDFVFDKKTVGRKIIQKNIGGKKNDPLFPTIYNSKWKKLNLSKPKDGYKKPKTQVSFDIKKEFTAGTYTLIIYGHVEKDKKEGAIKMKEYVTRDYKKDYGIATKCTGSSKLSSVNMDLNNLTGRSWDLLIEQKPHKYYDTGILISRTIDTGVNIKACSVGKGKKYFKIPNGCSLDLYVSNNGGTTWTNANNGRVTFDGNGQLFRWKIEMKSNSTETPKLYYKHEKGYAIAFSLSSAPAYMEYEDYQQCYETPLLNANAITRTFVGNNLITNRFSEWEFARLYMEEDEENESKIDILFSYADDDYQTTVNTNKDNWGNHIFFSQIFSDLTLQDFNQESVDYDNYEGNVEYDEHNYPFKLESEYLIHDTGGNVLAAPDVYFEKDSLAPYYYGNIAAKGSDGLPINDIYKLFDYKYDKKSYKYQDNEDDSTKKYSGMHIVEGPMWQAIYKEDAEGTYTENDVIIGISFNDILNIDENITHLTLGITPIISEKRRENNDDIDSSSSNIIDIGTPQENITGENTQTTTDSNTNNEEKEPLFFPAGTFDVVVAINQHGEVDDIDATNGRAYTINQDLIADEYNEITINLIDDFEGFEASGIGSIGIRVKDPENGFIDGEGIAIGRLTTSSYNIRPYVPYMYTGSDDRLSWYKVNKDDDCQAYAMYKLGQKSDGTVSNGKVFYPITNNDKDSSKVTIAFGSEITATYNNENNDEVTIANDNINSGNNLTIWNSKNISRQINTDYTQSNSVIKRVKNQITTTIKSGTKKGTYVTKDSGNETLFYLPKNTTGTLFAITTNIPFTIYDLIDIEYYVFTTHVSGKVENSNTDKFNVQYNSETECTHTTHGHFSKGDIYINFYDTTDFTNSSPVESFALPAWGRVQTRSLITKKVVHSWFKKRSNAVTIRAITIERRNPRQNESGTNSVSVDDLYLMLNNILLFNASNEAALGPQMQMRVYPNTEDGVGSNTIIRKIGGIYRI